MPQYCDSKRLEANWFQWIISKAVPQLEPFRTYGLCWTKVVGTVKVQGKTITDSAGRPFKNPSYHIREHCLAFAKPVYLTSDNGALKLEGKYGVGKLADLLSLSSDDPLYDLHGNAFAAQTSVVPKLIADGYTQDLGTDVTWHAMLTDINNMCMGIALKFRQQSDEERNELAGEALLQVVRKLERGKLVYTPGRAPVFNLLTTTIHRCMYSIINKNKKIRTNSVKLATDLQTGHLSPKTHSLKVTSSQGTHIRP